MSVMVTDRVFWQTWERNGLSAYEAVDGSSAGTKNVCLWHLADLPGRRSKRLLLGVGHFGLATLTHINAISHQVRYFEYCEVRTWR